MAIRSLLHLEPADGPGAESTEATRRRPGSVRRWLERLLFLFAAGCLGYYLYVLGEARLYQSFEDNELDTILASGASPAAGDRSASRPAPAKGSTVGRIEIPRLGVSAVIRAGSDARTLRLAVGYIPGTALPGENGQPGAGGTSRYVLPQASRHQPRR